MSLEEAIKILKQNYSDLIELVHCYESENCVVFEVNFKEGAEALAGFLSSLFVVWKENGNCHALFMNNLPLEGAGEPIKDFVLE